MPLERPLPNIEYLSTILPNIGYSCIVERYRPPVTIKGCDKCGRPCRPYSGLSGYVISGLHNYFARQRSTPLLFYRTQLYDEDSGKMTFRYILGLDAGELSWTTTPRGGLDWTSDYRWALTTQHRDQSGIWAAEARLFFWDLPLEMWDSIPWRDETRARRLWSDRRTEYIVYDGGGRNSYWARWLYCENAESPNWCAEIMVRHESLKSLLAADDTDPLGYITPETCAKYVKPPPSPYGTPRG